MKCDKKTMLLYAVTDRAWVGEQTLCQQVESALKGGVTCVQLREKELGEADFLAEAIEMKKLCKKYGAVFIVNDNLEVAIKSNADGIHVGQQDMNAKDVRRLIGDDKILGVCVNGGKIRSRLSWGGLRFYNNDKVRCRRCIVRNPCVNLQGGIRSGCCHRRDK
jgi:thiamine-phosphate diphosphorylase